MKTIKGQFSIKSRPLELSDAEKRVGSMRMMFEKNFTGTLAATSFVSMLGILNKDLGSRGYADLSDKMNIEIVNGEHFFTFEYSLTR